MRIGVDGTNLIDRKTPVTTFPKSQRQALRQSEALSQHGLEGRWEVPSLREAERALRLLDRLRITNIEVRIVEL